MAFHGACKVLFCLQGVNTKGRPGTPQQDTSNCGLLPSFKQIQGQVVLEGSPYCHGEVRQCHSPGQKEPPLPTSTLFCVPLQSQAQTLLFPWAFSASTLLNLHQKPKDESCCLAHFQEHIPRK
jgi:hypothetical protein